MLYAQQRLKKGIAFLVLLVLIGGIFLAYRYRRFLGFADASAPSIVFTSPAQILYEDSVSSPMTVQIQNPDKTPLAVDQVTDIGLSSSGAGTFSFDRNGPYDKKSVSVVTGQSTATFYYKPDPNSGNKLIHTITADPANTLGWNQGEQGEQVRQKTNLLENGSFELWTVKPAVRWSGWRYLPGCEGDAYQINDCSIEAGPGTPHSGNFYQRLESGGEISREFQGAYGRGYSAAIWAKPLTAPTTLTLSFRIDGDGLPTLTPSRQVVAEAGDWQQLSYTLDEKDIPKEAGYKTFRVKISQASAMVYLDDWTVIEGKEPLKTTDDIYLISQTTTSRTKQNTTTLAFERTPESASVAGKAHLFDKDGKEITWETGNLTSRNTLGEEEAFLVGGDTSWADYEFEAEVSDVFGKADLALVVRHYPWNPAQGPGSDGNYGHGYWYQEESSKQRSSLFRLNNHKWGEPRGADNDPNPTNSWQELAGSDQVMSTGDWHKMKVRVEGQTITAFLDGQQKFQITDAESNLPEEDKNSDRYRKGSVALYSRGAAKAKNLIVRDLNNNPLFASSTPPVVSSSFAEHRRSESSNWWDANYAWRTRVENGDSTEPVGQVIISDPNQAADIFFKLGARGADYPNAPTGQDLRLLACDQAGGNCREIDRDILALDQNKVSLAFAPSAGAKYFLYFGNPGPPAALSDKNNTYGAVGFWTGDTSSPKIWRYIYGQRDWKITEPGTYVSQQPQELTLIAPELAYDNQYTVRIDSGVKADNEHQLNQPIYFNFQTKKQPVGAMPSSIKISDGGLEVSGQKILPIMLYNFPKEDAAVVQDVKSKGINTISMPGAYASDVAQKGFWLLSQAGGGHGGVKMEFISETREQGVLGLWDEPNIIAWHTDSEPDLKLSRGFSREDFGAMIQAMKAVDPLSRPTYTDGGSSYAAYTDVIGNEAYAYSHNIGDLIFNIVLSAESNSYDIANAPNPGSRINAVDLNISPFSGRDNTNYPQKGEMRPKIYTAIIHGAKWLSEFSYNPSEGVGPVPQVAPEAWQELGEANNEILAIKDAVLAPASPQIQMVYPGAETTFLGKSPWFQLSKRGIDHRLFRAGDKGYLVAQNVSDKTEKAYFFVPGAQNIKDKNAGREIDNRQGKFYDAFGPYQGRIYEFDFGGEVPEFQIIATNPPGGRTDISPDQTLSFQFNHQVDEGTLKNNLQFKNNHNDPVDYTLAYNAKEQRLKVIPQALEANTGYTISFSDQVKDRSGSPLKPFNFDFKTGTDADWGANLFDNNASFEGGSVAPWEIENPVNLTGEIMTDKGQARDGKKYLKLSYGEAASGGLLRRTAIKSDQRFVAAIWAKSPTPGAKVAISEHFYDKNRNLVGDYQNAEFSLEDKWRRLVIDRPAPATATELFVRIGKSSSGAADILLDKGSLREYDATPPQVVKTQPQAGEESTPINSNIWVYFDKKMSPATLQQTEWNAYVEEKETGKIIWAKVVYDAEKKLVTIDPDDDISSNTAYQVTLVGGEGTIEDEGGTKLAANYAFDFTTSGETQEITPPAPAPTAESQSAATSEPAPTTPPAPAAESPAVSPETKPAPKPASGVKQTLSKAINKIQEILVPSVKTPQTEGVKPQPSESKIARAQVAGRRQAPKVLLPVLGLIVICLTGYLYWLRKRQPPM